MARLPDGVHAELSRSYIHDDALVPRALSWRLRWSDLGAQDRVAVIAALVDRGLSCTSIAEHLHCHARTVKEWRPLIERYPHLAGRALSPRSVRSPL